MADNEEATPYEAPTTTSAPEAGRATPKLRVWPAVILTLLLWGFLTLPIYLFPESAKAFMPMMFGMMGSYALLGVWWVFFSRIAWLDRIVGVIVLGGGLFLCPSLLYDKSVDGLSLMFFVLPWLVTGLTIAMVASKPLGWLSARYGVLAAAILGLVVPALLAFDGPNSGFKPSVRPRWQQSNEQNLLASLGDAAVTTPAAPSRDALAGTPPEPSLEVSDRDWPGFRGPLRDGHVFGGSLAADWSATPPKELWRHGVGPGWGSFCVVGDTIYTQEQRGELECIVAYNATTGEQTWSTGVETRFEESIAGPGPRATPTFFEGSLFAIGGAGDLQRLDAVTGAKVWARNAIDDAGLENPPEWGIASSPLLMPISDGRRIVAVYVCDFKQGTQGAGWVVAYDADSGEVTWQAKSGYHGYSSPHLATLHGTPQILIATNAGLESLDPATGERLWLYDWSIAEFGRSIQPLVVDDETVVLSAGYDSGTMPIRVIKTDSGWSTEELWDAPSQKLVPYYNDMVLHQGHLYGIHKKFLVCINLETGEPTWPRKVKRKAKVGNGQLVLDAESGMLVVTTEDTGEALLVEATPETLVIRHRLQAVTPERNWNHPVVANGRLYIRHGSEAACYELPIPAVAADEP